MGFHRWDYIRTSGVLQPAAVTNMVKLIFLDIDGVICCNTSSTLEPKKLVLLRHICEQTGE